MLTRKLFCLFVLSFIISTSQAQFAGQTRVGVESGAQGVFNSFFGYQAGKYSSSSSKNNTYIGSQAGTYNTTGQFNTFVGANAGYLNNTGFSNTFLGRNAGNKNKAGYGNTFTGHEAGFSNETGFSNTFIGLSAGYTNKGGSNNTFVGNMSGYRNNTGKRNTALGDAAGSGNLHGTGNVFLGFQAGLNETGSYKLYIENRMQSEPLIYGDFNTKRLALNTKTWPEPSASFVVKTHNVGGVAGMFIDASGNDAMPYYGYAVNGTAKAKALFDNSSKQLRFYNGGANRLAIAENGWVGINTTNTSNEYMLSVNGKIRAKALKVETNWADFVFADDYKLRSLEEVKSFIAANKHLPDVPSEAEVVKNGVDLGSMQATLLQKVEELTLYLLQAHEQTQQLHKDAAQAQAETQQLRQEVEALKAARK